MGLSALVGAILVIPLVGRVSVVLTGVVLSVLAVGAVISLRSRPRSTWELMAMYRGRLTTLYTSADQHEFEQVCRGLQRCLEKVGELD
jgi:hypothetical protein